MSIKTLESIVPPLELCKLIPEGCFADSVFVWALSWESLFAFPVEDKYYAVHRGNGNVPQLPAPTLAEIMAELPKYNEREVSLACVPCFSTDGYQRVFGDAWSVGYTASSCITAEKAATAALKLWLKLKGIKAK